MFPGPLHFLSFLAPTSLRVYAEKLLFSSSIFHDFFYELSVSKSLAEYMDACRLMAVLRRLLYSCRALFSQNNSQ